MNLKDIRTSFIAGDRIINDYLKDISKYKILTVNEEEDLVDEMKNGNEDAREKLILGNQRFVYAVAKRYGGSENIMDLVGEGNLGLMSALETFDRTKGNRFLSYAIWYIRRQINAYLNNNSLLVKKTNNAKTTYKLSKIKAKFFSENNRFPDAIELAEILHDAYGLTIKDKNDLMDLVTVSINTCFDDDDSTALENTPYFTSKTSIPNGFEEDITEEYNLALSKDLIKKLNEREQTIIKMSFGIGYNKEYANAEIGEEIGMTGERVRQLKNEAINKMQKYVVAKHLSF